MKGKLNVEMSDAELDNKSNDDKAPIKHEVLEKFIVKLLLGVEKIQGSNLSLRKATKPKAGLKLFMVLHYQENFNS